MTTLKEINDAIASVDLIRVGKHIDYNQIIQLKRLLHQLQRIHAYLDKKDIRCLDFEGLEISLGTRVMLLAEDNNK